MTAFRDGRVDCIFPVYCDKYYAEQRGLYVTDKVSGTSMIALVKNGGFTRTMQIQLLLLQKNKNYQLYIKNNYPSWTVVEAASEQDCIQAVRSGEADCAVFSPHRVDHVIPTERYDGLVNISLSHDIEVAFAVRRNDTHLLHILNQIIGIVPDSAINGALT